MITFACPVCSHAYRVPIDKAGRRAKCVDCGESLAVPLPPTPPLAPAPSLLPPPPVAASPPVSPPAAPGRLVGCKECGATVSPKAQACPHCGAPRPGAAVGRLHLIRSSGVTGAMSAVRVTVDGEFLGELKNGGTLTLDLATGRRAVSLSGGGLSRDLAVDIGDGRTARFQIYFSAWGALGGGLVAQPA